VLIQDIQQKLNSPEYLPPNAYRRNYRYYELVSYVNNITGCYLAENFRVIKVLIERIRNFIEINPSTEESRKYYGLVNKYITKIEEQLNEQTL